MQEGESEAFEAAAESEASRPVKRESSFKRRSSSYSDEDWPENARRKGIFRAAEQARGSESEQEDERELRHRPDLADRLGPYTYGLSGAPAYSSVHQGETSFKGPSPTPQNGRLRQ